MIDITMAQALSLVKYAESVSREERQDIRLARLKRLVEYVRLHSPYFRESYKEIGDDFSLMDLSVCNKRTLMANFNDWVTDPAVNESSVEKYLKNKENIGRSFLGKYTVLTTSGTSGVPLTMVRDAYHNTIHGAMIAVRFLTVLAALALEKLKGKLLIAPKAVACSAEQLTRATHAALKQAFNCPILNNYCRTEGGEAAMMCEHGNLHINDDWVILEPVDEDNRIVEKGSLSSSVLVTNLAASHFNGRYKSCRI